MANKFKIKFKLQGLELEVEGSRDDVPLITQAVGQQIAGMLGPAANIIEGEVIREESVATSSPESTASSRRPSRTKSRTSATPRNNGTQTNGAKPTVEALDWRHDPSKWGAPRQAWVTADKAIWLLYVAQKEKSLSELSAGVIAATFNKHFKQAKIIQVFNVNRDLGKLKTKSPARVAENTTVNPSAWYLTDEGVKYAEGLVAQARGQEQPKTE